MSARPLRFALRLVVAALLGSPLFHSTLAGQTYEVGGIVVNALTKAPLSKVTLSLTSTSDRGNVLFAAVSDAEGKFHLLGVPPGKYSLTGQRNGFRSQALDQHGTFATAIVVGPNSDASQLLFRMRPSTGLTVAVVDEENQPVRSAHVMLFSQRVIDGENALSVASGSNTSDTGHAAFRSLEPGTYYARVIAQPWYSQRNLPFRQDPANAVEPPRGPLEVAYPVTWYGGSADLTSAAPIAVESGSHPTVTVALQPVPSVRVRVPLPAESGRRHSFVQVFAEAPAGPNVYMNAVPQQMPDGILLMGLAPGRYVFEIQDPSSNVDTGDGALRIEKIRQTPHLFIKADVTGDMTLPLSAAPAASLVGKVVSEVPVLPANATLNLNAESGGSGRSDVSVSVDENLVFKSGEKKILPGRYRVASPIPEMEVTSVAVNGQPAKPGNVVTLPAGTVSLVVNLGQHRTATVNGLVVEQDKPTSGIPVYLMPSSETSGGAGVFQEQSDSDGSFSINVKAGKYIGVAIEDGYDLEYARPEIMKPYLAAGTVFEVVGGKTVQVKLEVQRKQ
jgi:hypothetical protein